MRLAPGSAPPGWPLPAAAAPALAGPARAAGVADAVAEICRQLRLPALVSSLDDERVAALLALPPRSDPDAALSRLAARLRPRLGEDGRHRRRVGRLPP